MAESEPKPKLIELVAPGAGQGWKAVLKNGKPAVVHEIPVPPAEAAAAIPRIQRLAEHRHPALSPVLAWGTDPNGIWVAVEPNEGTPLSTLLSRGPLTPPAAAALGAAVLSGVAALHEAGIAMGGFGASAIRITGNGEVRLAGHPAAAVRGAPSQSDLRADVRSCGMAVCAAFGVDPAGAPAPPNVPPGLVVTMRSMASGAMGPAADRAQGALREMAAALLASDRAIAAQAELATRASGREMPDVTAFVPKEAVPAPPSPAPAPFVPPAPRDETPIRAPVSYDAPARSMQTYPAIPAPTFAPAPKPPEPVAPPPEPRPIPTWSEAPPRVPAPYEAPSTPAATIPPAPVPPPPSPPAPLPTTTNPPAPAHETFPPVPARETFPPTPSPFTPPGTRSPFDSAAPASAMSTNPPAAAPPAPVPTPPPAPAPPAPPAQQTPAETSTWTPVEPPVWTPGKIDTSSTPPPWVPGGLAPKPEAPAAYSPPSGTPTPSRPAAVESFTVAAASAAAAAASAPAPLRAPAPTPARMPTVARRPQGRGGASERPPWLIPAVSAVVLLLLLGTGGFILAHRGSTTTGGVTTSPSARTSPKTSPKTSPTATPGPLAVPNFGPASAAPITSVIICSAATPCNIPGSASETATACDLASCKLEVGIYFSGPQRVPVSYILKFFDRCTGTTTDLPGPNPYTPPGYNIVIPTDHWSVSIPSGVKSGALVAVAQQPAVAASAPLMLGGDTCT